MSIYILGIETSCDETAAAVVQDGNIVLSNIVSSQIAIHQKFGGVVPEVASRHHVQNIIPIIEQALAEAKIGLNDLSAIAVTYGPGLVGSLLVGLSAAKALALSHNLPLIGVHHIIGHIYANHLISPLTFPLISLVVSGGHTELVYMKEHGDFTILGKTRDDAVGEAFDKVARALHLTYPGGPHLDRLAQKGERKYELPKAKIEGYDFSFSGLKTAVLNLLNNNKNLTINDYPDLARSFQDTVIETLSEKTCKAVQEKGVKNIIVAGGVAANSGLRQQLIAVCNELNVQVNFPPLAYCTDNAVMIAAAGYFSYLKKNFADLSLNAIPDLQF